MKRINGHSLAGITRSPASMLLVAASTILLPFILAGYTGNPLWLSVTTAPYLAYVVCRYSSRCLAYYRSLWPWSWASALGLAIVALTLTVATFVIVAIVLPAPLRDWSLGTLFHIGTLSGRNAATVPLAYPALAALYAPPLLLALPLLAWMEEEIFRRGTTTWVGGFMRSVMFGLVHLTAGVSVGVCLALSGAGLVFTYAYLRALDDKGAVERLERLPSWALVALFPQPPRAKDYAVFRATQVHLTYNAFAIIVAVLVLVMH